MSAVMRRICSAFQEKRVIMMKVKMRTPIWMSAFSSCTHSIELRRGELEGLRRLLGGHCPRVPSIRAAFILRRFIQHGSPFARERVCGVGIAGNRRNGAAKAAGTFLRG